LDNIYESLKSSSKDSTVTFGGGGGGGGGGDPIECTAPGTVLEREYVYGPNYIDEQVAQW